MDNCFNLSKHENTEGFDLESGKTWIYPTNMPVRDYQFNIIQQALFKNTLVCLPTGLGKTFIAAVVMYNFFRWYPNGKIIFMAPTKPLVNQQIDACYNIVAIPKNATAELTGSTVQSSRDDIWNSKRVFFITPQVLQNDLERISKLGKELKCLVFDEAHRARGNQAYCEVMRQLCPVNKYFRVLALSATPGNNVVDVVNVCQNLCISHLEIRTEDSLDVRPYVFKRSINTVVVPFDTKLKQVHTNYIKILDRYVRVLINHNVVHGNCSMLTKGRLFYVMKEFEEKNRHNRRGAYNEIMKNLNICVILYHAFEVLTKHGLRGFLNFFKDHAEKPLLKHNNDIFEIMEDIEEYLGPIPAVDMLPDGTVPEIPENTKFGHPKFYKLAEIILNHFETNGEQSKVIVFCEFRESVMEAYTILLKHRGILKPRIFLGQDVMSQKKQILVIDSFKKGLCNTLISTSIGEEGLDVGEVDLVICFDISNKSSIRMVQRMGRTGRKREGKVIMLVTEGREQQLLKDCLAQKDCIANRIANSKELANTLYKENPRMVPDDISPTCNKLFITVVKPKEKVKNKDLLSMFNSMGQSNVFDEVGTIEQFTDRIPVCSMELYDHISEEGKNIHINYSKYLTKQRILQSNYGCVASSENSKLLVSLLEISDSKRYNIPLTQCSTTSSTSESFKQRDIRDMFKKHTIQLSQINKDIELPQPKENIKLLKLNGELNDIINSTVLNNDCKFCDNLFECDCYSFKTAHIKIDAWVPPDMSVLDYLTIKNINIYKKTDMGIQEFDEYDDIIANFDESELITIEKSNLSINTSGNISKNISTIKENESEDLDMQYKYMNDTKPHIKFDIDKKSEKLLLNENSNVHDLDAEMTALEAMCHIDISIIESPIEKNTIKTAANFKMPKSAEEILKNHVDNEVSQQCIKDTIQLTAEISKSFKYDVNNFKDILDFFKLKSLEDLFVPANEMNNSYDSDATIIYSPNEYLLKKCASKFVSNNESLIIPSPAKETETIIEKSAILSTNNSNILYKSFCKENKKQNEPDAETSPIISSINSEVDSKPENSLDSPIISSSRTWSKNKKGQKRLFSDISPVENISNKISKTLDDTDIFDDGFLNFAKNKPIQEKKETRGPSPDIFGSYSSAGSKNPSRNSDDFWINDISSSPKNLSSVQEDNVIPEKSTNIDPSIEWNKKIGSTSDLHKILNKSTNVGLYKDFSKKKNPSTFIGKIPSSVKKTPEKSLTTKKSLKIDDICDISILDFLNDTNEKDKESAKTYEKENKGSRNLSAEVTINDICDSSILDIFAIDKLESKTACKESKNSNNSIKNSTSILNTSKKEKPYLPKIANISGNLAKANNSLFNLHSDLGWNDDDDFEESVLKVKTQNVSKSKITTPLKQITTENFYKQFIRNCNVSQSNNYNTKLEENSPILSGNSLRNKYSEKKTSLKSIKETCLELDSEDDDIFLHSPINLSQNQQSMAKKTEEPKGEDMFIISSDEFIESPLKPKKPNLAKLSKPKLSAKRKCMYKSNSNSSDDFEESPIKAHAYRNKRQLKKKTDNPFLDMEAQLSSGEELSEDEEGGSSQDMFESSFVNDETQDFANTTNMHMHYIQSVRSPVNRGRFKIPELPKKSFRDIYSQPIDESEENSYENDSFCVNTTIDLTQDLSELEIAEMILKEKRRNKKKGEKVMPKSKRRRIIIASDSD